MRNRPVKIVSGGQTGVDRVALDVALEMDLSHGGWCPRGRRSEDGRIDSRYKLIETESADYSVRTEKNVVDSDGTLILHFGPLTGGTRLTWKLAKRHHRPVLKIDLQSQQSVITVPALLDWIHQQKIQILNVAGPRETSVPGIGKMTREFLTLAFASILKRHDECTESRK